MAGPRPGAENARHWAAPAFTSARLRAVPDSGTSMGNSKKRWILGSSLVLLVAISASLGLLAQRGAFGVKVERKVQPPLAFAAKDIVRLEPHRVAVELSMPGSVQPVNQTTVRSKLSAEVLRLPVREGDRVAAGQVIAEFDTAKLRNELAERQATLESARATLAQTERTRATNAQLVKQSFISQNAFESADDAFRAQVAAVKAAEAQLAQTKLLLADAVVLAPIAGQVARRHVQPGEKVSFDAPLLHIVDLKQLEVQAQAPVADVAKITVGAAVDIEIEGVDGRSYPGRIDRINPTAEPGSRIISVYLRLANDDGVLRGGMFARVKLQVGGKVPVPSLPIAAVHNDRGQAVVWIIDDGKLARRVVATGVRDERARRIEIVSGLTGDEKVIGAKFDNLREGMAAHITAAHLPVASRDAVAQAR